MTSAKPQALMFADDGLVPNNPTLAALVYKGAVDLSGAQDPEATIETMFRANGWGRDMWRDSIFPFVHYHSMIHEALGIARGRARVRLGGDNGAEIELQAGDIAVLPAGTGHQRLFGSNDFSVIGGYPPEGIYNLCRGSNPADRDMALTTLSKVPLPQSDPVHGKNGPLTEMWR